MLCLAHNPVDVHCSYTCFTANSGVKVRLATHWYQGLNPLFLYDKGYSENVTAKFKMNSSQANF
jgi:hypothetical protein